MPEDTEDEELGAIKCLLNHRLPPANAAARVEWLSLVDGTHELWNGVRTTSEFSMHGYPKYGMITRCVCGGADLVGKA